MSEPEVRLVALCDHALVGQDGKVSIVGIFRNISVSSLPAEHPRMYFVAILALAAGPHTVVVQLSRPDGSAAMPNRPEISVHGMGGEDVNVIVELKQLVLSAYGMHRFDLALDGTPVAAISMSIEQMPTAPGRRAN